MKFIIELIKRWWYLKDFKEAFEDARFVFNDKYQNRISEMLKDFKLKTK